MTVSDQGMNCRRRQSHAGFTLLELLISITLLGFILVLLFGLPAVETLALLEAAGGVIEWP